ncbi:unnamed protein product [Protopolystoma xenopodis]|uniref:Vacuolar protein-sorting-associated protein 36 n=1 Tax=Protopolystoma xenopodis TaxID=117903 RepID=A0A3S5C9J2_9PLAT|nr:unnamed protein product [Protopolystoma xenopodis]
MLWANASSEAGEAGLTEDETAQWRSAMLSMGIIDANSCNNDSSSFHVQLAYQISSLLSPLLQAESQPGSQQAGQHTTRGCIDLASAYCRLNRARGVELISPDDLIQAGKQMEGLQLPLRLKRFPSGIMVSCS